MNDERLTGQDEINIVQSTADLSSTSWGYSFNGNSLRAPLSHVAEIGLHSVLLEAVEPEPLLCG